MPYITETTLINCFRNLFARFGRPETLVTDNGPNLIAKRLEQWLFSCGCDQITTAGYHPKSNSLEERMCDRSKSMFTLTQHRIYPWQEIVFGSDTEWSRTKLLAFHLPIRCLDETFVVLLLFCKTLVSLSVLKIQIMNTETRFTSKGKWSKLKTQMTILCKQMRCSSSWQYRILKRWVVQMGALFKAEKRGGKKHRCSKWSCQRACGS